jgi:hypothetical protein
MPITQAVCTVVKQALLDGTHAPGDTYRAALYTSAATLNAATTVYTATNEVVGTGYTATGQILSGRATSTDASKGVLTFSNPSWASSTITARGMLIYNASKSNAAVAVYDFGSDVSSTNGTFTVSLPAATGAAGLFRIA